MPQNPGQRMMRVVWRVVKSLWSQNLKMALKTSEPPLVTGDICARSTKNSSVHSLLTSEPK